MLCTYTYMHTLLYYYYYTTLLQINTLYASFAFILYILRVPVSLQVQIAKNK